VGGFSESLRPSTRGALLTRILSVHQQRPGVAAPACIRAAGEL